MNKHLAKAVQSLLRLYKEKPTDSLIGIIHQLVEMGVERKEIPEELAKARAVLVTVSNDGQKTSELPLTFLTNCDFTALLGPGRLTHSMGCVVEEDPEEDSKAEDDKDDVQSS